MTINRSELKQSAKDSLRGRWGTAIGIFFIYIIVTGIAQSFLLGIFVAPCLLIGLTKVFLQISRNQETNNATLFEGFPIFWKAFGLTFMVGLFTMLWSLLFVIPGIIASLSYSMALYIMADNKSIGIMDAIKESKRITEGYKWDIFVLGLSFIGWSILCILSIGIGFLWLVPYIKITYANLYNKLSGTPEIVDDGDFVPTV